MNSERAISIVKIFMKFLQRNKRTTNLSHQVQCNICEQCFVLKICTMQQILQRHKRNFLLCHFQMGLDLTALHFGRFHTEMEKEHIDLCNCILLSCTVFRAFAKVLMPYVIDVSKHLRNLYFFSDLKNSILKDIDKDKL